MAMSNRKNDDRAKAFIKKAMDLKDGASHRERLYIEAFDSYINAPDNEDKEKEQIELVRKISETETDLYVGGDGKKRTVSIGKDMAIEMRKLRIDLRNLMGEKISLGTTGNDVISIKNFFLSKNILAYKLSEEILKNHEIYYQRIIEFSYPIKMTQKASILVSHKAEDIQKNCELLHFTQTFNIYECK